MLAPALKMPPIIQRFFDEHVVQPFDNRQRTPAWVKEVLATDWRHLNGAILENGKADFDAPYNDLPPEDKVLIYCRQYMQMHVASSFFLLDRGTTCLGLGSPMGWIILDFGCGPLTLGV